MSNSMSQQSWPQMEGGGNTHSSWAASRRVKNAEMSSEPPREEVVKKN